MVVSLLKLSGIGIPARPLSNKCKPPAYFSHREIPWGGLNDVFFFLGRFHWHWGEEIVTGTMHSSEEASAEIKTAWQPCEHWHGNTCVKLRCVSFSKHEWVLGYGCVIGISRLYANDVRWFPMLGWMLICRMWSTYRTNQNMLMCVTTTQTLYCFLNLYAGCMFNTVFAYFKYYWRMIMRGMNARQSDRQMGRQIDRKVLTSQRQIFN